MQDLLIIDKLIFLWVLVKVLKEIFQELIINYMGQTQILNKQLLFYEMLILVALYLGVITFLEL